MKNILSGILALVLVAAIGVGVYIFGFDKTIPEEKVTEQIAAVKAAKLVGEDGKAPSVRFMYEKIKYTKDGDKTVVTYEDKYNAEFKNKSTESAEAYDINTVVCDEKGKVSETNQAKYYMQDEKYYKNDNGTVSEISDFSEAFLFFLMTEDFYETSDGSINSEIVYMINNYLDKVTQKGVNITLHTYFAEAANTTKVDITYSLLSKKIVRMEIQTDTYDGEFLTNRLHEIIEL